MVFLGTPSALPQAEQVTMTKQQDLVAVMHGRGVGKGGGAPNHFAHQLKQDFRQQTMVCNRQVFILNMVHRHPTQTHGCRRASRDFHNHATQMSTMWLRYILAEAEEERQRACLLESRQGNVLPQSR